jgi:hypothetical protein
MVPREPEDNTKESLHPLLWEAVREIQSLSGVGGLLPEVYSRVVGAVCGTRKRDGKRASTAQVADKR